MIRVFYFRRPVSCIPKILRYQVTDAIAIRLATTSKLRHFRYKQFYRAAVNAGRSSHEKAVCLSVKRVDCDKTDERSVQIFIPCERHLT